MCCSLPEGPTRPDMVQKRSTTLARHRWPQSPGKWRLRWQQDFIPGVLPSTTTARGAADRPRRRIAKSRKETVKNGILRNEDAENAGCSQMRGTTAGTAVKGFGPASTPTQEDTSSTQKLVTVVGQRERGEGEEAPCQQLCRRPGPLCPPSCWPDSQPSPWLTWHSCWPALPQTPVTLVTLHVRPRGKRASRARVCTSGPRLAGGGGR